MMLKIAEYNELQILTVKMNGCYLDGGSETVFLPTVEVPDGAEQGDYIEVYIYRGSGRPFTGDNRSRLPP